MSDRDESVPRLAERIAFAQLGWPRTSEPHLSNDQRGQWQEVTGGWMAILTVFLSEREATLRAQLARAMGEGAGLREAGEALVSDPYGCPFCDSGVLRNPSKEHADDCGFALLGLALASAPLSERAGEVTGAAVSLADIIERIGKRREIRGIGGNEDFVTAAAELCIAVDALRAELAKGGEGG